MNTNRSKVRSLAYIFAVGAGTLATVYLAYVASAANTTIGNNISTSGTLTVGNTALFSSTLRASSTLQVTGTTTLYGALVSTSTATSTFANGIQLTGGCFRTASGTCLTPGGGGGGSPAGSSGQLQFNDGGAFGADSNLFWDNSSKFLGIGTTSPTEQLSVAGRLYVGGSGTSTIENNLKVLGNLQVGAGTITLSGNSITFSGNLMPANSPASTSAGVIANLVDSSTAIQYPSMAIGGDGFPVIAYYDNTNQDLKVTKCANALCSSISATTTVDSIGDVGVYASIATTTDGLPIIAYQDNTNTNLKVVKCGNASCSSGNAITILDGSGNVGQYISIAVPADGLPVISYMDSTNTAVKVVKCGNNSCSSGNTITTALANGSIGNFTAMTLSSDGFPIIATRNEAGNSLLIIDCANATCASTSTTAYGSNVVNGRISMTLGSDGNPVLVYNNGNTGNLTYFKCGDAACSTGSANDFPGFGGSNNSVAIAPDGFAIIASDNGGILFDCSNISCTAFNHRSFADSSSYVSILIASDGFPNIAYTDGSSNLRFVDCPNNSCTSGTTIAETSYLQTSLGNYSVMALDSSENPMIAYADLTNNALGFVHCGNSDCTSGNASTTVDTDYANAGVRNIAIATSTSTGFPIIAYGNPSSDLKIAFCNNNNCSSPTINTVSTGDFSSYVSMKINPATGRPIIAYYSSGTLKVAYCEAATTCSSATINTVESFDNIGSYVSLAIASDGNPIMVYRSENTGNLFLTKCDDVACAMAGNASTTVYSGNGTYPSLAKASDGNPVFAYRDDSNSGNLVVVKCGSATCNTGNSTTTVDVGDFYYPSLQIGSNGSPSIAYYLSSGGGNLKFARCTNASCGTNTKNTVDHAGSVGVWPSLMIRPSDGLPVIAHQNASTLDLKLNKCDDVACANEDAVFDIITHPNGGASFDHPSLAKGSDDLPIISYYDSSNQDLKVTHCNDVNCASVSTIVVDSAGTVGGWSAIKIGNDNLPVIAYEDETNSALKVAHCNDNTCSSATITTIESGLSSSPEHISMAIGTDGFPVIAYTNYAGLRVAKCGNAACTSGNTVNVADAGNNFGYYTSIAIGADGFPIMVHSNQNNWGILRVVKCGNASCSQVTSAINVNQAGTYTYYTNVAIGQNGLPIVSYAFQDFSGNSNEIQVIACSNASCTGSDNNVVTAYTMEPSNNSPIALSMTVPDDGLPIIFFLDNSSVVDNGPSMLKCGSPDCSFGNSVKRLDKDVSNVERTGLAISSDGNPILAYISGGSGIKYVKCGDAACQSFGGANFTGGSDLGSSSRFFSNGYIESIFANQIKIKRFDLAEDYFSKESLEAGDIVMLDQNLSLYVRQAVQGTARVIGVVSTEPALVLSDYLLTNPKDSRYPVALAGRVPVKVNLEGGSVKIGDPITLSSEPGVGKKAGASGQIVGYALEDFNGANGENNGKILVFVGLGHWQPEVSASNSLNSSLLAQLINQARSWLESMKVVIEDGLIRVKQLFADKVRSKNLELIDSATGEIYCVGITNGEWQKTLGECASAADNQQQTIDDDAEGQETSSGDSEQPELNDPSQAPPSPPDGAAAE